MRELIAAALKTDQPGGQPLARETLSRAVVDQVWEKFGGHSPDERVDLFRNAMETPAEQLNALIKAVREAEAESLPKHSESQDTALQKWMESIPDQLTRVLSAPLAEMAARGGIRLPLLDSPESIHGLLSAPAAVKCVGDPIGDNGHLCSELLHVGPQSEIWLAEAPSPGPPAGEFAIVRDPAVVTALRKERDELARIQTSIGHHPHIQALKSASLDEENPWVHYEALNDAHTLEDWIHGFGGPVPPHQVIPLLKQVASGLAAAHRAGIVHADVRPANIRLVPGPRAARDPTDYVVKIAGFGLGGVAVNTQVDRLSSDPTAAPKGLGHVTKERLSGRPAGAADDVFSLGVLAYQMLLGDPRAEAHADIAADLEKLGAGHGLREMISGAVAPPAERLEDANKTLEALKSAGDLPDVGAGKWVTLAVLGALFGVAAYFSLNPLPEVPSAPPPPVPEVTGESAEDLARRAEAHAAAYDVSAAERLWKRASDLDPENTDYVVHHARLLVERECLKAAEKVLREHLKAQPDATDAQALLASVLLEMGTPAAIEESTERVAGVLLQHPEHPLATRVGGELASREGGASVPAIILLRKAVALAPEDPETHQKLHATLVEVGARALQEGDMESAGLHLGEAWSALQEGLAKNPGAPELLVAKADVLFREGKPALAMALLETARRDAPGDDRLYEHIWDWVARHMPQKLLALAQSALAERPESALRHALLGAAQAENVSLGDAKESLDAALEIDPEHLRTLEILQEMLASAASLSQSREVSGKLLELLASQGSPEALRQAQIVELRRELAGRGPAEDAQQRAEELVQQWQRSREDPRRSSLLAGLLSRKRGNHFAEGSGGAGAEAYAAADRRTRVPPAEEAMAAAMLGAAAEAVGEPDLASLRYERCLKANPGDPECVGRQMALHAEMGWEIPESLEEIMESLQEKCAVIARMTLDDLAEGRTPNPAMRKVVEECEHDPLAGSEARLALAAFTEAGDPAAALELLASAEPEDLGAHGAQGIAIRAHLRLGDSGKALEAATAWADSPGSGTRPVLVRSLLEWMRGDPKDAALRARLAKALDDVAEQSVEDVVLASEITALMKRPGALTAAQAHGLMPSQKPCAAGAPCALDSAGAVHAALLSGEVLNSQDPEFARKAMARHSGDRHVSRMVFHHLRRDLSTEEKASEHIQSHLASWPRDTLAWARRGRSIARRSPADRARGSNADLESIIQRMMATSPDWVHGQVLSGWLYLIRGDRKRADAALTTALNARPDHPLARHLQGVSQSMEPVLRRDAVVPATPEVAPSGKRRLKEVGLKGARKLLLRGLEKEASAALEVASKEAKKKPQYTYLRAVSAVAEGRLDEADELLRMLGTRPDVPPGVAANALDARVEIHRRQGRLVAANKILCAAARSTPHQFPAFNAVHRQVFGLPEDIRTFGERKSVACR